MKNTVNNMPVTPNSGGGGSRGGWLGKLFGMVNARSYEMLQRDRFQWQQGVITDEMSKRATNAEAAKAAGRVVGEKMSLANRRNAAFAFERKRTSKNKKTGEYNYPDLVDMGPAIDPLNARWSPGAEVQRSVLLRRDLAADHRGRHHGFLGSGPVLCDVPAVRVSAQEGQLQELSPGALIDPCSHRVPGDVSEQQIDPVTLCEFCRAIGGSGEDHESFGIRQEDVPQLQNHPSQGRGACDLHRPPPQAAPGLMPDTRRHITVSEDSYGTYCWHQHPSAQAH